MILRSPRSCCTSTILPAPALFRSSSMSKINFGGAFGRFSHQWSPKIAGELNDSFVKLAKFFGQFHWHHHEHEDELFLVVSGRLPMGLRTGDIDLDAGEFIIVPKEIGRAHV